LKIFENFENFSEGKNVLPEIIGNSQSGHFKKILGRHFLQDICSLFIGFFGHFFGHFIGRFWNFFSNDQKNFGHFIDHLGAVHILRKQNSGWVLSNAYNCLYTGWVGLNKCLRKIF